MADQAQSEPPRYRKIADQLRAEIKSGAYDELKKLPSEAELTKRFNVARNTVRDALQVLHAEDLTESRKGSGVYLRTFSRIKRNAVERLSKRHWGAGRSIWDADLKGRARQEGVTVDEIEAREDVAGVLGIAVGARVWVRSRLYYAEGRPVQQSTAYYPAGLVAGTPVTRQDTGPGGVYARLNEIGHGPARYREEIKVRLPFTHEADALKISRTTPVIFIVRTAFDQTGLPVEVNEMLLDSNSYELEYDFPS